MVGGRCRGRSVNAEAGCLIFIDTARSARSLRMSPLLEKVDRRNVPVRSLNSRNLGKSWSTERLVDVG